MVLTLGVAQHLGDAQDVRAALEQVGGEGVPQGVRMAGDAGAAPQIGHQTAHVARAEWVAGAGEQHAIASGRRPMLEPDGQSVGEIFAVRHRARLAALAVDDQMVALDVVEAQIASLSRPQSAAVEKLQQSDGRGQ